ncbi:MAG: flagellar motor protein MotA [Xanthobacteraceae bacterium]
MANSSEPARLASPRIFLVRMLVFLILCGLIAFVLQRQIINAFNANPWLNGLILLVLLIGIILSFARVIRLFPEVSWVNSFRRTDPGLAIAKAPTLLAPMAAILSGDRVGRVAISAQTMRAFLDSVATRLDEARDTARYLTGLLVFLGLLGTFWGLIETVGSVGGIINNLNVGGDADSVFNALKEGLAAPLGGMGISFSSSLFGLAGSLILGFLDLQTSQAQNRFYINLEDWLATTVQETGAAGVGGGPLPASVTEAIERLRLSVTEAGSGKATTAAMANLAEAIQGLVQHMRAEQQMIRDWADAQAKLNSDIRRFMEVLSREAVDR